MLEALGEWMVNAGLSWWMFLIVVNILLLHQITGEMYLTRNRRKVLFIDELKQQLGDIGADMALLGAVAEDAELVAGGLIGGQRRMELALAAPELSSCPNCPR